MPWAGTGLSCHGNNIGNIRALLRAFWSLQGSLRHACAPLRKQPVCQDEPLFLGLQIQLAKQVQARRKDAEVFRIDDLPSLDYGRMAPFRHAAPYVTSVAFCYSTFITIQLLVVDTYSNAYKNCLRHSL